MPDFFEMLNEAESNGWEWLIRSVSSDETHISGDYFAHIHGPDLVNGNYFPSFRGSADTAEKALRISYDEMREISE